MKIKAEHLQHLKDKILPNITEEIKHSYETGAFPRSDRVKDLQTRFNCDLVYMFVGSAWICDNLYSYMNDTHLNSALNSFVPKIERKY